MAAPCIALVGSAIRSRQRPLFIKGRGSCEMLERAETRYACHSIYMTSPDSLSKSFGLIIAFLIPGAVGLYDPSSRNAGECRPMRVPFVANTEDRRHRHLGERASTSRATWFEATIIFDDENGGLHLKGPRGHHPRADL
jgi:hypothetical protein